MNQSIDDEWYVENLTQLLNRASAGDSTAREESVAQIYDGLRALASKVVSSSSGSQPIQPTVLAHELFLRVFHGKPVAWESRSHFWRYVARSMRNLLIDTVRRHDVKRRASDIDLDRLRASYEEECGASVLEIDEALQSLAADHSDLAEVADLRLFGGLSSRESAETLGLPRRTVERRWEQARVLLALKLQ